MKIINEIKKGFIRFDKRACIVMAIGMLISMLLFGASVFLYLAGGIKEQNMITYFASTLGEYAVSALTFGAVAAFFVDIVEKSAEKRK